MVYECEIDLLRILHATLCVLDNGIYEGKGSKHLERARACLREAIVSLELASRSNSDAPPKPHIESAAD